MTSATGPGDGSGRPGADEPPPVPFLEAGIDFDRANAARIYDYFLGGGHNFGVDRDQARRILVARPDAVHVAQANRAFLGRVVRWSVEHGVDQFLDLGSGVPTVGNVHEIAHQHDPAARVAYVDFEPVAVAHAQEIIGSAGLEPTVSATRADLRDPASVLLASGVAGLLDFSRPIAVLTISVLHFVPGGLVEVFAAYRDRLSRGSIMALSHAVTDDPDPTISTRLHASIQAYDGSASEVALRSRAEVIALLDGLELVPPGLVDVTDWPDARPNVATVGIHGAVGLVL